MDTLIPVICELALLFIHLVVTVARLLGPGGTRSVVAESLLDKRQLLILKRSRTRAPVCSELIFTHYQPVYALCENHVTRLCAVVMGTEFATDILRNIIN